MKKILCALTVVFFLTGPETFAQKADREFTLRYPDGNILVQILINKGSDKIEVLGENVRVSASHTEEIDNEIRLSSGGGWAARIYPVV